MGFRDYKVFKPGQYYHVYNRGNNKMPVFIDSQDYQVFLHRLKLTLAVPIGEDLPYSRARIKPLPHDSVTILAYCLMPNHYHFLLKQGPHSSIDKFILKVCTSYAKYFNAKYDRVGHVFQDAFKAKLVDSDQYLIHLSAYIHSNPPEPIDYPYSSLSCYLGQKNLLCDSSVVMKMFSSPQSYRNYLENIKAKGPFDSQVYDRIL